MSFPTQMCRVRYWIRHCCGDWKSCPLSSALWEEYEKAEAAHPPAAKTKTDKPA